VRLARGLAGAVAALGLFVAGPAPAQDIGFKALVLPEHAVMLVTIDRSGVMERPDGKTQWTLNQRYRAVLTRVDGGYRVKMEELQTDATGDLATETLFTRYLGAVTYLADEGLFPTAIEDWDAAKAGIMRAIDQVTPRLGVALAGQIKQKIASLTAEQAVAVLQAQSMVATGQGLDLRPGAPAVMETSIPNPIGGPPILGWDRYEVISPDPGSGREIVTYGQAIDPKSAAASMLHAFTELAARSGQTMPKGSAQMTFDRAINCRFEIDRASGLAATTSCDLMTSSGLSPAYTRATSQIQITQTLVTP